MSDTWCSGRLRPLKRAVMVVCIFLGGAACGAAVMTIAAKHAGHHFSHGTDDISGSITSRLAGMLELTDEQSVKIREIILRRHNALIDMRREIQPRLEVELAVLEEEIAAVLNEEQNAKWHAHASSVRAQWLPPIPERPGEK